jgi:hypothetical protein
MQHRPHLQRQFPSLVCFSHQLCTLPDLTLYRSPLTVATTSLHQVIGISPAHLAVSNIRTRLKMHLDDQGQYHEPPPSHRNRLHLPPNLCTARTRCHHLTSLLIRILKPTAARVVVVPQTT